VVGSTGDLGWPIGEDSGRVTEVVGLGSALEVWYTPNASASATTQAMPKRSSAGDERRSYL
jgi:hypothetical protein